MAVVALVTGIGLGWYSGHTRPAIRTMSLVREAGASDEDIIRMYKEIQQMLADHRQDDLYSVAICVNVLSAIEDGDMQMAEKWMILPVSSYYRMHLVGTPGEQLDESRRTLKQRIEVLIQKNDTLRARVEGKKSPSQ